MDEHSLRIAFERAVKHSKPEFEQFFLAQFLGLQCEYDDEACVVQFEVKDYMFNPQGTLHGGVIATVMDISMGHLLKRMSGPGTTLEMKTQYVRPVQSGKLYCTGEFTHRGRGISYLRSSLTDAEGNLIAFATATWKLLKT